jgi:hypothetical protein
LIADKKEDKRDLKHDLEEDLSSTNKSKLFKFIFLEEDNNVGKIRIGSKIRVGQKLGGGDNTEKVEKHTFNIADLESIKKYVQAISTNSNPIGKMIECLGDDVDAMNKELQSWIEESQKYKIDLDREIKYIIYSLIL